MTNFIEYMRIFLVNDTYIYLFILLVFYIVFTPTTTASILVEGNEALRQPLINITIRFTKIVAVMP